MKNKVKFSNLMFKTNQNKHEDERKINVKVFINYSKKKTKQNKMIHFDCKSNNIIK